MPEETQTEPVIASVAETESVATVPCAICRRQFSRYTCPRCNIPYCSLVCFRSEKHGDCSETFYRKEVELDVKTAPSASVEEKRRMMDLLRRFEEDALDDSPLLADADNDESDTEGLSARLENVDLDSASYEELWDALTPAQREKFLHALDDPHSELAQKLLSSAELERDTVVPWWETPTQPDSDDLPRPSDQPTDRRHGLRPSIMPIPAPLAKQSSATALNSPFLLYNLCALSFTYVYIVRHFAVSPLSSLEPADPARVEIRRSISQLVPFLTDRKSTLVHSSLSSVVTDLWSRFPPGHMDSRFFSLLLNDSALLLRPATVAVVPPPGAAVTEIELRADPSGNILRVLSDLSEFFSHAGEGARAKDREPDPSRANLKSNHLVHKLTFYAAYVLGMPAPMLRVLADEVMMRAKALESEAKRGVSIHSKDIKRVGQKQAQGGARIQELT
ncbi:hypothetical protein BC628DRAFT_1453207 [Trametes gibbosa]|uniref:HIT-type domain-containing protein n=1 Tax=Trametes gibbosa TaxID=160864 RepID=A0A6G6FQA3_9APHY|nr:hypothetical protein BC628DRAFT_1453207 [Trametes gibbosa]QIE48475.1 hypothetical protein [Trametes gibbosa]